MSIQSTVNLNVQIPSGPNFAVSSTLTADAYSRAAVTIPKGLVAGAAGTTLELQPGAGTALLLAITSSDYSGNVKYNFGGNAWALNGPQLVWGSGLIGALALGQTVVFDTSNAAITSPVNIDVLVLRKAVV